VLRSWRRFVKKDIGWREILIDIWRLACLDQVYDGRTAGLFRVGAMIDSLEGCLPFLERIESALREALEDESEGEILINPEVAPDGLTPVGCDLLIGRRLIRICGEKRPDMYAWTETWLTAFLFVACGYCKPIQTIQMLHPFTGRIWSHGPVDLLRAKQLYAMLLRIWDKKTAT